MFPKLRNPNLFKEDSFCDGKWVSARGARPIGVVNPSTGETIATVRSADAELTRRAIDAASKALKSWGRTTALQRGELLRKWYELMIQNADDLAAILTAEQGKPLAEAKGEILYGASYLRWFAAEAERVNGELIPPAAANQRILALRQPIGVCAAITPWNFPCAMITRKVGPALAAGCAFVLRPSSLTPLSALALAVLAQEAGIPDGVFNVLCGPTAETGTPLAQSDVVRKFSFTGSTEVGRKLMAQCAGTVKKVSLELGGNAPFIVFDDADVDAAVEGAIACKFRNAGQTCVCANRLYAQSGIYDEFVEKLAARASKLVVGDGFSEGVEIGPLIGPDAVEKSKAHIQDAIEKGGKVLCGNECDGLFFKPTVISGAKEGMRIAKEETFGPVAAVFKFDSEQDAVRMANDTIYGLASYVYARDYRRIARVSEALEYGIVGVNSGLISNAAAPFGGVKQSGIGREGSTRGIDEYVETKYVMLGGVDPLP